MLKADGLTIELDYDNGTLIEASTRGNGEVGEIVTHNAKVFKNLPLTISFKGKLKITGEAIIHKNDFDDINSKLPEGEKYKTPRNLVAGSVRQLDSKMCSERQVYFYGFNILECDEQLSDSKDARFDWLSNLGFQIIISKKISGVADSFSKYYVDLMKSTAEELYLPIDGVVGSFDSVSYSNSLGETSHHPLHSIAYKFEDLLQETTLINIDWQVGRTGTITPVANFEPVEIDGTSVTKASVHNLSILEELELGVGDIITVYKANMIIPQIEENLTRSNTLKIPQHCPVCGGITIIEQLNESKVLYCTNDDCYAKLLKKFVHFVSRDAMNIEGLSEATLEKFIDKGYLINFTDIFKLEQYKKEIVTMDGFGVKSYNNLIVAIDKSRKIDMCNFLYALGISQIGLGGAKRLSKHFNNDIDELLSAINNNYDLTKIEDFGDITAQSVIEYFKCKKNYIHTVFLLDNITINKEEVKAIASDNPFKGKKIYATGKFANYKKDQIKSLLESLGAEFASGYAKSLNYLIEGSLESSSKVDKAKKDGVPVLTEAEFIEMID